MQKFSSIQLRAEKRKGGADKLEELLSGIMSPEGIKKAAQLEKISDDRYLSAMTKAVFKAGFVWKVIDNKWPEFESAFWKFNIRRCCAISPEDIDALSQNVGIVRNLKKIQSVQHNASM